MPDSPSVALLGTGTMGVGMAHSILRAGLPLTVWNRSIEKARPLEDDGATVAESAADAVRGADVVVVMLFDADAVVDVLGGLGDALSDDAVVLQSSTVGLAGTEKLDRFAKEHGITMLDSPVVGTKQPAEDGKLAMLVSGPEAARDAAQPVLDAMGGKTVYLGERIGDASALKLVANSWVATITAGAAQAIALAAALRLDPHRLLETVSGGAADSPYLQTKGSSIIEGSFDAPQFALDGVRKDLDLIRTAADGAAVPTELIDTLVTIYGRASELGHGGEDIAAVATAFAPTD